MLGNLSFARKGFVLLYSLYYITCCSSSSSSVETVENTNL
nr:MAG TPA: hypothetical protein [Microviridae sp.]